MKEPVARYEDAVELDALTLEPMAAGETLGFTGTQRWWTPGQHITVAQLVRRVTKPSRRLTVRHGGCVGSDEQFHETIRALHKTAWVVIHRPDDDSRQASCAADEYEEPAPFLVRDEAIAEKSTRMIATPHNYKEMRRGSGTWATSRYARRHRKVLYVVWPDGKVTVRDFTEPEAAEGGAG